MEHQSLCGGNHAHGGHASVKVLGVDSVEDREGEPDASKNEVQEEGGDDHHPAPAPVRGHGRRGDRGVLPAVAAESARLRIRYVRIIISDDNVNERAVFLRVTAAILDVAVVVSTARNFVLFCFTVSYICFILKDVVDLGGLCHGVVQRRSGEFPCLNHLSV